MINAGDHSPELRRFYGTGTWKTIAARIRKRDRYRCRACNKRPHHKRWYEFWLRRDWLVVHHMSYAYPLGQEPDDVLITLDRACHEEVHARHRAGTYGGHEGSLRECTMSVVAHKQSKLERQRIKRDRKIVKAASGNRKTVKAV